MGRLRALVLACHPLPTAAVTVVSVLLAAGVGLSAGRAVLFAVAVFTGQLSIGWSNDAIDAARDARNERSDKPAARGDIPVGMLRAFAVTALVVSVALSIPLGIGGGALLLLVAAGWAYNLGLKSTVWSGAAYVIGFGAFGAAPYLARHESPPWWAPTTGALLGLAAHVANVLPDLRADAETGVRGLPHRLGARVSTIVLGVALAAASVVLSLGPSRPGAVAAVGAVAGCVAAAAVAALAWCRPDSPAAFRLVLVLVVLDVALVAALAL